MRIFFAGAFLLLSCAASAQTSATIPAGTLRDKIHGGFLGQVLGDLNGLQHEMKYISEPGSVSAYTPALPKGAWTDDDTDFEWVYVVAMESHGAIPLPYPRLGELWKAHINRRFWCANEYARQLMDLGIDPPLTGKPALNPWSDFNISGQFVSETFGLMSPGMPQTAARLGLHHTHVTIDGEPAQATQFFTSMIATAFFTADMEAILNAGMAAVDPASVIREIAGDVRAWHRQFPKDWRAARRLVKEKYSRHNGAERDRNGHELNTASAVAALLYGEGDFIRTLTMAFNFGWDADNNAATAGTILGVIKGRGWMMKQDWQILDNYRNTSRDNMPPEETLSSYAGRIVRLAERNILLNGGEKVGDVYRIRTEQPAAFEKLSSPSAQFEQLRARFKQEIESGVARGGDAQQRARAAYMAICLDFAAALRERYPQPWARALSDLAGYRNVMQVLFFPRVPTGEKLREKALAAGLPPPAKKEPVWK